jgi:hypothetical protein
MDPQTAAYTPLAHPNTTLHITPFSSPRHLSPPSQSSHTGYALTTTPKDRSTSLPHLDALHRQPPLLDICGPGAVPLVLCDPEV